MVNIKMYSIICADISIYVRANYSTHTNTLIFKRTQTYEHKHTKSTFQYDKQKKKLTILIILKPFTISDECLRHEPQGS